MSSARRVRAARSAAGSRVNFVIDATQSIDAVAAAVQDGAQRLLGR
jgi:L-alanine-DL-glutamate epimerase-like enolase superfamily enzyme